MIAKVTDLVAIVTSFHNDDEAVHLENYHNAMKLNCQKLLGQSISISKRRVEVGTLKMSVMSVIQTKTPNIPSAGKSCKMLIRNFLSNSKKVVVP